jgi:hypothetical protein
LKQYATVFCGKDDPGKTLPKNMGAGDQNLIDDSPTEPETGNGNSPSSYMAISFQSNVSPCFEYLSFSLNVWCFLLLQDILELTVTKTALDVMSILSEDFQEAVKSLVSQKDVSTSAYTIVNDCGVDIKLNFLGSAFALVRKGVSYEEALLRHGTTLNLGLVEAYDLTKHHTSILKEQEGREERLLNVSVCSFALK